jgi:DNA-binding beta-propeller fold protein YncE
MSLEGSLNACTVDGRKLDVHNARSGLRVLMVCALLCSLTDGCGGGGGSSSSAPTPPPQPTSDSLLAVTNADGSIDLLTIDTTTGTPTPVSGDPIPDGPTPAAVAIDPLKRFLYVVKHSDLSNAA